MSAEQPHSGDERYYSAAVANQIDSIVYEIGSSGSLNQYLTDLNIEYQAHPTCGILKIASQIVAPKNTGSKKELLGAKLAQYSCYSGSLLGLRMSQKVLGERAVYKLDRMSRWPEVILQVDPDSPYNAPLAAELGQLGDIGYESSGQYRELADTMALEIVPIADLQIYAKRGFGLSMYQLARAIEVGRRLQLKRDLESMKITARKVAIGTIDLDKELDKLLEED